MESSHFWLLSCLFATLLILTINGDVTHKTIDFDHHENLIEDEHDMKLQPVKKENTPMALDPRFNKMLLKAQLFDHNVKETTHQQDSLNVDLNKLMPNLFKLKKNNTFTKPALEITSPTKTIEIDLKKSIPLAEDPRFNKMLPEKNTLKEKTNKDSKKDTENSEYDYDDEDYDQYYDQLYDESSAENKNNKTVTTQKPKKEIKMKPIKGDDKGIPKETKKTNNKDDYEDDYSDEVHPSKKIPCPRDCICDRNLISEKVATCSRLDADIQKFGSDITDLIVVDVGPKYPIILGPSFFVNIGLKNLNSLTISNCTLELLHPNAFNGLNELYAVNLTNVGITHFDPDTFASNKILRLLKISGNDLSSMTSSRTRTNYLIKSTSIEELDLSNNNFKEIQPNAFINLPNIVYINLANNELKTLPKNLFNSVETIEDLDLSHNKITFLPPDIFNRTALARLDLKYNDIIGDLRFGTSDIQILDLSYCSLKVVNNHMFSNMTGLMTLNLKGNGITRMQPDSFTSLNFLRHIDLSFNNLEQISSMLFYKNPNLDVIRLNDNAKLSELPPDGFQSFTRVFAVYLLDISNCAINVLGKYTFSHMPHLTTLKLSWNNINNMHKDTFMNLQKLTELDLSNNLIVKLDENIFKNNKIINKINLSGNPIREISSKLFHNNVKLAKLDVSDCELSNVLEDNYYDNQHNTSTTFFDTLRVFNVSFNKIKKITKKNIRLFKNLKTFSFEGNLLKCNDEFKSLVKYLIQKGINSGEVLEKSILEIPFELPIRTLQGWDEITKTVCKRENEKLHYKNKQKTVSFESNPENDDDDNDDDDDDDDKEYKKEILEAKKILATKEEGKHILDGLKEEDDNEKEQNNAAEEKESDENDDNNDETDYNEGDVDDDDDDDDEEDNDDNDDNEDSSKEENDNDEDDDDDDYSNEYDEDVDEETKNKKKEILITKRPKIKNHGLIVDEVNVIKETNDKYLIGKLLTDADKDELNPHFVEDDDDAIIIQHGHISYNNNKILIIILIILTIFVLLLLTIMKIVSTVIRKRGERYRMAILASKNSIVYQKLSEEIIKPINKNPKVHRYSRINEV